MNIQNNGWQNTYNKLCNLLDNQSKVYYSRFGDGDFNIMSGIGGELYHNFSSELQKELQDAFFVEDGQYVKGVMLAEQIFNGVRLINRGNINDENLAKSFVEAYYFDRDSITFDSHVMFTYMAICQQEKIIDFLDKYIRPKKKLFVGSVDKSKIEKLIGKIDYYVPVPCELARVPGKLIGAYYTIGTWFPEVLKYVNDVELVIPTAGMAGRVLTKRLWYLNKNIHCIELGSMVDAATGVKSRSTFVKNDNINKIKNLLLKEV